MSSEGSRFATTEADGETIIPMAQISQPGRHERNSCAPTLSRPNSTPIHRLPVHILREIFIYVPMIEFDRSTYCWDAMPFWMSASQVCGLWRRITLNTPEFWTSLPLQTRHSNWTDLAITRSHPLPVSLIINASLFALEWYRAAVLRVCNSAAVERRAREMYWVPAEAPSDSQEKYLDNLVQIMGMDSMPYLESYEGQLCYGGFFDDRGEAPSELRRVKMLFNYTANRYSLPLHAPLTYLELVDCYFDGIVEALRCLPSLRTLVFIESWDIEPPSTSDKPAQVWLPHLEKLQFHDYDHESFVDFMDRVLIPSNTIIDFRRASALDDESVVPAMIASLTKTFSDHLREAVDAGLYYQNLAINRPRAPPMPQATSDCTFLLSNPSPSPDVYTQASLPRQIIYDISGTWIFPYEPRLIPRMLPVFRATIQAVRMLDAYGLRMQYLQEWLVVARCVPQVSQVNVNGAAACGLVMTLAAPGGTAPFFPLLHTVSIEQVVFADRIDERPAPLARGDPAPLPEDSVSFIDGLQQALVTRAAIGLPVRCLTISRCEIAEEMVQSLRAGAGVDEVTWDFCVRDTEHAV